LFKAVNENENFTGFREGLKDYFQEKMLKDLKKSPVRFFSDLFYSFLSLRMAKFKNLEIELKDVVKSLKDSNFFLIFICK